MFVDRLQSGCLMLFIRSYFLSLKYFMGKGQLPFPYPPSAFKKYYSDDACEPS